MAEGVAKVSRCLLEHGVTAYCPTVVTASPDYYKRTLPLIRPTLGGREGAAVLGTQLTSSKHCYLLVFMFRNVDIPLFSLSSSCT